MKSHCWEMRQSSIFPMICSAALHIKPHVNYNCNSAQTQLQAGCHVYWNCCSENDIYFALEYEEHAAMLLGKSVCSYDLSKEMENEQK